jgi:hypothetical protein
VMGTTVALVGEFFPTKSALDRPFRIIGGDKLVPAALAKGWNRYGVPAKLGLPCPKVASGFELIARPSAFTDTRNRIQPLTQLRDVLGICDTSVVKDVGELGQWVKKNHPKLDEPEVAGEFQKRVRTIIRKHEPLQTVLNPHEAPAVQVKEKQDLFDLFAGIDVKTTTDALVQVTAGRLVEVQKAINSDGEELKSDLLPHVEAIAGLSLFGVNGGHKAPIYLINCRDVNEVLTLHRPALIKMLSAIRGAHYVDLGILNRVSGGTGNLIKLGSEMDKQIRGCVWATLGGVANEEYAIKIAENNPIVANDGAGSVFVYVGMARHYGHPAVMSAACLGKRIALDQRYTDDEFGPMTSAFGPLSSKHLDGIDDFETSEWSFDTLKVLAKEAGLNAVTRHSNGVISPYLGRTLSSLENFRYIDGSRLANLLSGFIMAYLDVNAGRPNIPRVQRALCERADSKFLAPFKSQEGFTASLVPLKTSRGPRFDLAFEIQSPDPMEEIVFTRRRVSTKKA